MNITSIWYYKVLYMNLVQEKTDEEIQELQGKQITGIVTGQVMNGAEDGIKEKKKKDGQDAFPLRRNMEKSGAGEGLSQSLRS